MAVRYTRRMLLCTVRDCHLPLARPVAGTEKRLVCPRGHSFDIARSGYINLLQPQERRSKKPGDTTAAVAARRRLHDRGVTEPLLGSLTGIPVHPNAIGEEQDAFDVERAMLNKGVR